MIERLGGRKFLLTLIAVAVGTAVELTTARGITTSFAGLLAALVAAYGAANAVITNKGITMNAAAEGTEEAADAVSNVDFAPIETKLNELAEQQMKQAELLANVGLSAQNTNKLLAAALNQGRQA